ncbi:MAG: class B sortase [Firmicutes bacterium]|nr:class B sortase [Bacillota bacterium]
MAKSEKKESAQQNKSGRRRILFTVAFLFFLVVAVYSASQIFIGLWEYHSSQNEYEKLREIYEPPEAAQATEAIAEPDTSTVIANTSSADEEEITNKPAVAEQKPPLNPAEVNKEYIGWLKISSSVINYPIVQAQDNEKYLKTSFEGNKNGLGAVFMDFRCAGDFSDYHSIVYAHNAKNGTMFGSLAKYLDAEYLNTHREITITMPDGEKQIWYVFAARKSDINDHAYRIAFSSNESFAAFAASIDAPEGINRILTLSTCTTGGGNDERMLVHASQ